VPRSLRAAVALVALAACAGPEPLPADAPLPTERAVQLARVRCLLIAPLENASDDPLVPDAATGALVGAIDTYRTRVYPIEELKALFKGTALELPDGVSASLALELGEIVGADAVLYGSVEGRSRGTDAEVTLTIRLAATGVRDTLFWRSVHVTVRSGETVASAARRAAREAAEPMLGRIGVPGKKVCFERQRIDRVRLLAAAEERTRKTENPVTAPLPGRPPPVNAPASPPPAADLVATAALSMPPPPPPPPPAPHASAELSTPAATARTLGGEVTSPDAVTALRTRRTAAELEPASAPEPPVLTRRQAQWSARLGARQRFVVEDVAFAGRSGRLEREEGLADLARALSAKPAVRIRLEGFVDASKDGRSDLRVSMELARAAGLRLIQLGVRRDRVTWAGRGGEAPIAPNFSARGRASNRRVEVVVQ
jgi:outer membrane protein OmpA-like peptidoglycan-associated protein